MTPSLNILSDLPAEWKANLETTFDADGITVVHFHMAAASELPPPAVRLGLSMPLTDMSTYWTPSIEGAQNIMPEWGGSFKSNISSRAPIFSFISSNDRNRITVTLSEALRPITFTNGVHEMDSTLAMKMLLFDFAEAPLKVYDMDIRIDQRDIFFADAIREASAWFETYDAYKPLLPPKAAFEAIYSSWYSYHQDLFEAEIEAQCKLAKDFGLTGIIVDDGWQTDDNQCSYAFCGEWQVSKRRFPNMREHVKRVHAMGLRYLIWYSVPFVGFKTDAFKKFEGKYLYTLAPHQAGVLDPRFPEVREYLINIYENAVKEWDLDGLKLDFIDRFTFENVPTPDPAIAENYAGRDIKSLATAVDVLLSEVIRRLRLIKPDILVEFRQNYIGPAIRKYGNMFRASDCPNDYVSNRIRTLNLRLTSGGTAVHSDMLEWHETETPENAAMQLLNIIFSVPQVSVKLEKVPESHRQMLRFWLDFCKEHTDTLLHGVLKPYSPVFRYPLVEANGKDETIFAVYNPLVVATLPANQTSYIVNSTQKGSLALEYQGNDATVTVYDCLGNKRYTTAIKAGMHRIDVPPAGLAAIK